MQGFETRFAPKFLPHALLGRIRGWRAQHRVSSFRQRTVHHSYGGVLLNVRLADPIGREWYDRDWDELPELVVLRASRLRPGATVFNLGAHQGVIAMLLAHEVGPQGRVIAVEASPHNAAIALENCRLNGFEQITIVPAAIAARSGRVAFNKSLNGQLDDGSGARGVIEVDSISIDDLVMRYGHPDVVFMDIEGAECLALAGGASLFQKSTDFFVEAHVGCGLEQLGGDAQSLLSSFDSSRFTLLVRQTEHDAFRPLRSPEPAASHRFFLIALDGMTGAGKDA